MNILPSSFNRIVSRLRPAPNPTIPTDNSKEHSRATLFDDLPAEEKKAALEKLDRLAAVQPVDTSSASSVQSCPRRRRFFNWKNFIMVFLGLGFVAFATAASVALAVDTNKDPDLVAKLRMANTNLDRMALL